MGDIRETQPLNHILIWKKHQVFIYISEYEAALLMFYDSFS